MCTARSPFFFEFSDDEAVRLNYTPYCVYNTHHFYSV